MKKIYLAFILSATAAAASALTLSRPVKINIDGPAHNPVLNATGTVMLFSSADHTGLKAYDLTSDEVVTIGIEAGAGFNPVFTADGKGVVYQTAEIIDGLMHRDIHTYSFDTKRSAKIAGMSRDDVTLNAVGAVDYVSAALDGIDVCLDGNATKINPVADAHSYLWASLSPEGKRIAFCEPFQGVFVCDIDGRNLVKVSDRGDFPAWAGNDLLTYTVSHDDGYVILDSTLKIHDLSTGIAVNVSAPDVIVGESCSAPDGTVVYSTLDGDIYILSVK